MTTAADVQPTHHTLEVPGVSLHYLDWGNPAAPTLLLVHGLSSSAAAWQRVVQHFVADFHVIALDQRGHGDSSWVPAERYDTDSYVADLEAFIDGLGLQRFVLVGHSMGGHHTLAYTARHPERVRCAVVNDIPPAVERDVEATAERFPGGRHPVFASVEAWMESERPAQPFTPEHILRFSGETRLKAVEGGLTPRYDPNASIHWAPKDLWDEARTISRPVLLLRGGRSSVLDAATLQQMDMQIEPARSITLEKSGHNTFFDMEPEFIHVVSDFIAAHAGRA
ncbi:MAG: alpha/beta hydrolase [Dehalococcoidia bacterium]|nr:alpha/beta hydrolase [Dehalococcoidia bacterium]